MLSLVRSGGSSKPFQRHSPRVNVEDTEDILMVEDTEDVLKVEDTEDVLMVEDTERRTDV